MPEHMRISGSQLEDTADDRRYRNHFLDRIASFLPDGKTPAGLGMPQPFFRQETAEYKMHLMNAAEFKFTLFPPGVPDPVVRIDLTRSVASLSRYQAGGVINQFIDPDISLPAYRDQANDDRQNDDEDSVPKQNLLYSLDTPGFWRTRTLAQVQAVDFSLSPGPGQLRTQRLIQRLNALEFVRIDVAGNQFTHTPSPKPHLDPGNVQGSRASELVAWHSWADFTWDTQSNSWIRAANTPQQISRNDIGPDFWNLNEPPF